MSAVSFYDDDDRLLTETLVAEVARYTYDNNGNVLSRIKDATDQVFYHWNAENSLDSVDITSPAGTHHIQYQYNADRIRVAQAVDGQETRYLIDANRPLAQVMMEYTPGGPVTASYVYGTDLIAQERGGQPSFYLADGQGSTRLLTNGAGAITERYVYDAFGRVLEQLGTSSNTYLFTGQQRDLLAGLDYLRARYFDFTTGRFLGRDPFSGVVWQPLSRHPYLYAADDPVNRADPTGRDYTLIGVQITLALEVFLIGVLAGNNLIAPRIASPLSPAQATEAKQALDLARNWAQALAGAADAFNWRDWFDVNGTHILQVGAQVHTNWVKIYNAAANSTVSFVTPRYQDRNVIAYVFPGGDIKIYLTAEFWRLKVGNESGLTFPTTTRAAVLLHELSHEVAGTDDVAYAGCAGYYDSWLGSWGQSRCYDVTNAKVLADEAPLLAVQNADNYALQAEDLELVNPTP